MRDYYQGECAGYDGVASERPGEDGFEFFVEHKLFFKKETFTKEKSFLSTGSFFRKKVY
jgi:hypothetical protein